jgi:hypothetical protein
MKSKINSFVEQCVAIDETCVKQDNSLVYMARSFVSATLPHSKPKKFSVTLTNGNHTLSLIANPQFGLPYGSLPRLIIAIITKQAVITKNPEINLGHSFAQFISSLKYSHRSGGVRGDAARIREQMIRLLTTQISVITKSKDGYCGGNQFVVTSSFNLWWNPLAINSRSFKYNSTICLSAEFYKKIIDRPIPIDLRALIALRRSPMQIDIYIWLTYKFSQLNKTSKPISWIALQKQFGAGYPISSQGKRDFKKSFLKALHPVQVLYHEAVVDIDIQGIVLKPSPTHVKRGTHHGN